MIERLNLKVHQPIEIRFVKGDDIYLSPSYGADTCWIGIIMYKPYNKIPSYSTYFNEFMRIMEELDGRPHWAKIHNWGYQECQKSYPMFNKFNEIRKQLDPTDMFSNNYTRRIFNEH
eukprot:TRINITY_DN1021_c0_g1_i3.p1 TRINITY_DN1021_c0_g1~~TRINITY_DN1021_c0_g1_i3.p1  ORF type:complete len:117 (-),score=20.97 TRINITY_DN1021_c0_g1_i3:737-1087(-)